MSQPAPGPYGFVEVGVHGGTGSHIYLTDAEGRKIGVVWGKREQKPYTAQRLLAGANHAQKLAEALDRVLLDTEPGYIEDWAELRAVLAAYKEAMK